MNHRCFFLEEKSVETDLLTSTETCSLLYQIIVVQENDISTGVRCRACLSDLKARRKMHLNVCFSLRILLVTFEKPMCPWISKLKRRKLDRSSEKQLVCQDQNDFRGEFFDVACTSRFEVAMLLSEFVDMITLADSRESIC